MWGVVALISLLSFSYLDAQTGGEVARPPQAPSTATLPSAKLIFSEPNLDSPLQLPSTLMDGPPICGPDGRAFIKFLTPPMYNQTVVFSISPRGSVIHYPVEQITGLTYVSIVSFDPGTSAAVMLLRASAAGQPRASSSGYYLALFKYDGEFRKYSKLNLGLEPSKVVQLSDDSFLVMGANTADARPRFAIIDSSGSLLRELADDAIVPSEKKLKSMLQGLNFAGAKPGDVPPSISVTAMLSLFRPAHSDKGLLILEPGAGAQVIEIRPSGETRLVSLRLPQDQNADSIITNKRKWFVRAFLQGSESESNLYEVDSETGDTLRRINTSVVPATSIACPTDTGFYGFRWIERKPYLVFGELR